MRRLATLVAFLLSAALIVSAASAEPATISVVRPLWAAGYRAGSAGSVFGPATAIGDFDADGHPDFAIADRMANSGGVDYRVEVRLSTGASQIIRFASSQRTLAVTAVDIDHDNDLDLVFTPVVGRRVVGVWLNDGTGHFARDTAASPRELDPLAVLLVPRFLGADLPATVSHRRAPVLGSPLAPSMAVVLAIFGRPRRRGGSPSFTPSRPDAPRGPPALA